MYKPKIFLVEQGQDRLMALEETEYMTESALQELLVNYPDLLPGDQIDPENPRRWLLVAREMSVPGDLDEIGRWSLDHLFLDQEGIPTFVECKCATDTRIRREVVAQMLDYATNGVEYWSMDRLRQAAAETAQRQSVSLDNEIARLLGEDEGIADVEAYWEQVESNLRNRRVRLVFVADSTPRELRRLVEFLNEEMANVEVLAVEVKQFQENEKKHKALVPRVVGLTEAARRAKKAPSKRTRPTTPEEFIGRCDILARDFFQRILELAEEQGHIIYWGQVGFSVRARLPNDKFASFAYGYPPNEFQFYFGCESLTPPGKMSSALRRKLLGFGVFRESGKWTLKAFVTDENLELMNEVYSFILDQVDGFLEAKQ